MVTRVDPAGPIDLSGRWNDADSRMVAEKMTNDLLSSEQFNGYAKKKNSKPIIIFGQIKNKTTEHIDADNFIKKIELAIFNSGIAGLVESGEFRNKLREERASQQDFSNPETVSRWGEETGADLMLFGEITSEVDVYKNKKTVNYIISLFLTDMESNNRIWYGQHEIKKFIRN